MGSLKSAKRNESGNSSRRGQDVERIEARPSAITLENHSLKQLLFESRRSQVYRGLRESDQRAVIFKILRADYPTPEETAWFRREYEITRGLDLPGVVGVYDLLTDARHHWVMLLEDFGGTSLAQLGVAGKLSIPEVLDLALRVTDILDQIHRRHIIHKDLTLANIVLNPDSGVLKLIDFGISSRLARETAEFQP